ncbi:MAG: maleylpyruvate isomerase N-terminal domain-containing protein, partial [Actinomycetota bacterium]|nr:maleylpyruvate isomerase N-terminal domain-containing protein [Actinomycetota bacterium]
AIALRDVAPDELLDRLRKDQRQMSTMLAALGPEEWTGMMVTHPYMGPVPAFFYAGGQLMDYGVHSWDIREGTGRAHALSADAADLLVPFMFALWQGTVREDRDTSPFEIGIRVSGRNAADYRVSVDDKGMTYQQADIDDVPAIIDFDPASLVLTTFGRTNAGTVTGDTAVAERYLNLFFRI